MSIVGSGTQLASMPNMVFRLTIGPIAAKKASRSFGSWDGGQNPGYSSPPLGLRGYGKAKPGFPLQTLPSDAFKSKGGKSLGKGGSVG